MITPCLVDISLTNIRLTKCAIHFGGRRYTTTSKLGVAIVTFVNGGNHHIVEPSYLPGTGHLPVDRPFRRVSLDLVEYKTKSVPPTRLICSYALTIIDNLTRFAVLVTLPDKKESRPLQKLLSKGQLISSDHPRYSIPIKARSLTIKL